MFGTTTANIGSLFRFALILRFFLRKSAAKAAATDDVDGIVETARELTPREIRLQLVRKHEAKVLAEKLAISKSGQRKDDLILSVEDNNTRQQPREEDTDNTPGNSDDEEPTVNDDDNNTQTNYNININDNDTATNAATATTTGVDGGAGTTSPPYSPMSIYSATVKPELIHPPRLIQKVKDEEEVDENASNTSNTNNQQTSCGMLCGCI